MNQKTILAFVVFLTTGFSLFAKPIYTIPFTLHKEKIFITAYLYDTLALNALFDIGTPMYIHSGTAQKHKINYDGFGKITGFGGTSETNSIEILELKMGELPFRFEKVNSQSTPYYENRRVDLVFGREWVDRYVVEIDYDASVIKLFELESYEAPLSFTPIETISWLHYPIVKSEFVLENGDKTILNVELNIGVEIGFQLDKFITKKLKIHKIQKERGKLSVVGSDGRAIYGVITRVPQISLGKTFVVSNVRGAYFENGYSAGNGEFVQGMLGQPVLKNYNIIFDSQRKMVLMKPKM